MFSKHIVRRIERYASFIQFVKNRFSKLNEHEKSGLVLFCCPFNYPFEETHSVHLDEYSFVAAFSLVNRMSLGYPDGFYFVVYGDGEIISNELFDEADSSLHPDVLSFAAEVDGPIVDAIKDRHPNGFLSRGFAWLRHIGFTTSKKGE